MTRTRTRITTMAAVAASLLLGALIAMAAPAMAAPAMAEAIGRKPTHATPTHATPTHAALPLARPAGVNDFTFRSMDVDYTLGRDADGSSTLKVVETFVAEFPAADQNHGMRRSIPDHYNGQPLFPKLVSITDENGAPRESETDDSDNAFTMTSRAPGFVHGAQTYVFTYALRNVTWTFPDTGDDEFYWDVNGVDWAQPFGRVSATLHLDPALAKAMTGEQSCYRGAQGSTQKCTVEVQAASGAPATVTASATDLKQYETVTIAVGFRKGTFTLFDSSYLASPWGWVQGVAGIGALAALVFAIVQRVRRLKDAAGRPTIIAEYTPPQNTDAFVSAVLLGLTPKAVPAEVLELAIAGAIRIVEGDRKLFGGHRLQAELVDPAKADEDGRMLLAGMFGPRANPGDVFEFGTQNSRFASAAQQTLKWGSGELVRRGMKRKVTGWTRGLPVLVAAAFAAVSVATGVIAFAAGVNAAIPVAVGIVGVVVFILVVVLMSRSPLSAEGAETRDHLLGLKVFIEWAEADRIRMLQSPKGAERVPVDTNDRRQMLRLYEALLPYAVVFGQEKQWAGQLMVMYGTDATPYWYVGTGTFDAQAFSSGIGALSAAASSSSSTSGGASGGGSAGGGGGGGGGGGV